MKTFFLFSLSFLSLVPLQAENVPTWKKDDPAHYRLLNWSAAPDVAVSTQEPAVVKKYCDLMNASAVDDYAEMSDKIALIRQLATRCYRTQEAYLQLCLKEKHIDKTVPQTLLKRLDINYTWMFESLFNRVPWLDSQAEKTAKPKNDESYQDYTNKLPHDATSMPELFDSYGQNDCTTTMAMNFNASSAVNAWKSQMNSLAHVVAGYHYIGKYPFGGNHVNNEEKAAHLVIQMQKSFSDLRVSFENIYDIPRYMGSMHGTIVVAMNNTVLGYQEAFLRMLCKLAPLPSTSAAPRKRAKRK